MAKLKTIETRVESILKNNLLARNCDKHLLASYMYEFHNIVAFSDYAFSSEAPSFESIRRCRQKIQARGEYLASGPVRVLRNASRKEFKNYALNP